MEGRQLDCKTIAHSPANPDTTNSLRNAANGNEDHQDWSIFTPKIVDEIQSLPFCSKKSMVSQACRLCVASFWESQLVQEQKAESSAQMEGPPLCKFHVSSDSTRLEIREVKIQHVSSPY